MFLFADRQRNESWDILGLEVYSNAALILGILSAAWEGAHELG